MFEVGQRFIYRDRPITITFNSQLLGLIRFQYHDGEGGFQWGNTLLKHAQPYPKLQQVWVDEAGNKEVIFEILCRDGQTLIATETETEAGTFRLKTLLMFVKGKKCISI